ncbi:hypothetical protein BIFPSEUDO_02669 [Bifidobacterium pseudocatenulatum DSM 20438 = JCM 1200 = LMG 10505]|uniref:Uncharacterized protein n=1 Tax=Bifidobacterium pseudocatenulatum DSM 20438 = JCM 1200 = LMG 10505 TaxID=547043 RepID=C0BQL8_BIFPS|nr:hypothetical protein BIFPSEUDO_02669 [Bifidobacterium pseudocatenulatum DSM 20438 = JCM 1200 = LMG 10505]
MLTLRAKYTKKPETIRFQADVLYACLHVSCVSYVRFPSVMHHDGP